MPRAIENRRGEGLLRQRKGAGGNRGQRPGHLQRAVEQRIGRTGFVDQSQCEGIIDLHGAARVDEIAERAVGHARRHDLQREGRERHADRELGNADAARAMAHDPPIAAGGEDAAAGNRMAVHGGDHRFREHQRIAQHGIEHWQEAAPVVRPPLDHAEQVDAGGERRARAGQDDGPDSSVGGGPELGDEGFAQLDVHRADLAVGEPQNANAVTIVANDHQPQIILLTRAADYTDPKPGPQPALSERSESKG